MAYDAKMPERNALKIPWPDTGSKLEAASPTHSSGRAASVVTQREPAGRRTGIRRCPRCPRRGAHVIGPSERPHESFAAADAERTDQVGVGHAGDDAPASRDRRRVPPAVCEGLDHRAFTVVGTSVEHDAAADQPVEIDGLEAARSGERAGATGGIDRKARRQNGAIVEGETPAAIHTTNGADVALRMRRDPCGRRMPQHGVEAGAVEPPSDLLGLKQEFIARETRPAPHAHRAIGRTVSVGGEPLPQTEMLEQAPDRRRHGLADLHRLRDGTIDQADVELGCEVGERDRRRTAGRTGAGDHDVEVDE